MNILFYMSENALPINNGVTIAAAGNAIALASMCNVYLYNYANNSFYQITGKGDQIVCASLLNEIYFEQIICTPILGLLDFYRNGRHLFKYGHVCGLLNDVYSYVLWRHFIVSIKLKQLDLKDITSLLKIPYVYLAETILTAFSDSVIIQTNVEKDILNKFYLTKPHILSLPNGPQMEVSDLEIKSQVAERGGVGFVASFNDTYMKVAKWFITEVWISVVAQSPHLKLHILGKNKSNLFDYIKKSHPRLLHSIIVEPYHDDLKEFYLKRRVVVSPIFKNFGLINKTVEAMQCGCAVVGDIAAFNGIEGVIDEKHAYIANEKGSFINKIILASQQDNLDMSLACNKLISNSLSWQSNAKIFMKYARGCNE